MPPKKSPPRTRRSGRALTAKEEEFLRRYNLIEAARTGSCLICDDVTIDLACDLDPIQWQPIYPLGLYGDVAALHGPEIIFPWTDNDWRSHYKKHGSVVEAPPGSRVSVRAVVDSPLSTPFDELDHPANREVKVAYLLVTTADGQATLVQRPLVMLRTGAVANRIEGDDYPGAYQGMLHRLEDVFGVEDIETIADGPHSQWPKVPEGVPKAYGYAFIALRRREEDFDGHAMAAFGYMMARAEAEERLLASARRGADVIKNAMKATSAKVAKDRAASEPIRERARSLIEGDPAISLTRCAKLIAAEFDKDQRWIARTIRELFVERRSGREYRPRQPSRKGKD